MGVQALNLRQNGPLFFYFVRKMPKGNVRVYKSELQKRGEDKNYSKRERKLDWNTLEILASTLAIFDFERPLSLEVWKSQKSGNHIFIGAMSFTINQMMEKSELGGQFHLQDKNGNPNA